MITFIGGGNMSRAIISGMLGQGFSVNEIFVVDINKKVCTELSELFGIGASSHYGDERIEQSKVWVLAIKPQHTFSAVQQLLPCLREQLIVSVVAGIRQYDLSRWLGNYANVIRTMPNLPALIGAGMTALYASEHVLPEARVMAEDILKSVGQILWVDVESSLDVVVAISGSGPAYVFYLLEIMQEAGEKMGLQKQEAATLALQTCFGSAQLALQAEFSPKRLREQVSSQGGTTESAVACLERLNVRQHFIDAIMCAHARSRELAVEFGNCDYAS